MGGGGGGGDGGAALQREEEARKDALRQRVNALYQAPEVLPQLAAEEQELSNNLRGHYSTDLQKNYEQAERNLRFGASNTGNVGGSVFADETAKLNEENRTGGTRIEEAVRRAVNNLRNAREDSRTRSISLINAGEGESGVQAASQGLRQAIDSASSAGKENLFSDLFANLALAKASGDATDKNAAALAYFNKQRGGSFIPTQPANNGTIIRY